MDVVKLPKKVRMVCYEIMDGKEGALDTLESPPCVIYRLNEMPLDNISSIPLIISAAGRVSWLAPHLSNQRCV